MACGRNPHAISKTKFTKTQRYKRIRFTARCTREIKPETRAECYCFLHFENFQPGKKPRNQSDRCFLRTANREKCQVDDTSEGISNSENSSFQFPLGFFVPEVAPSSCLAVLLKLKRENFTFFLSQGGERVPLD